jgi:replicative DNA helicase
MEETTLPYDIDSEDVVLGSVIHNIEEYDKVSKYFSDKDVFYQDSAKLLWKRITEMKRAGEKIDTLSVCSTVTKKDSEKGLSKYYITGCTSNTCAKGAAEYYASRIYEKYLLRRVIVESEIISVKAKENDRNIYDSINKAHSLYGELLSSRPSFAQDIEDVISDTLSSIKNKTTKLVKTGYANVDKFAGGLTRGEVTIIGGRPGHGKTTVMVNLLSKALENGHKAMFFSRELPNSELFKKIICLESEQLSYSMVRKNVFNQNDLNIVNNTISQIRKKYNKDKFLMFDNLRDFAMSSSEVKKFKPDIIFDDYIQLIACEGYEDSRRLQIERLVNDYKWLAKETDCVVVLASQLNRGIERDSRGKSYNPQLSDLAESGAIEQVAENVFFSYYDYKVKGEAGKGKNIISLHACKVRYGDSGVSDLGYDGDKCKIYNSIEEMVNNDTIPF